MSRAAKPATKAEKPAEYALTPTEAYRLHPAQVAFAEAEDRYGRAHADIRRIAVEALERCGVTDADLADWTFDVRDDGVFLVRRGK